MPAPYSLDLRRKAVLAYEEGEGTQQEIAQHFGVGLRTLKEWLFIRKTTGDVQPKEYVSRGRLTNASPLSSIMVKRPRDTYSLWIS